MSKNVFLTPEIILHGTHDEMNNEFFIEYSQMFESLDLSSIPRCNEGVGATGYDQHAMIKAFIVYTKEGYRSILQLIRELKAKPYFSKYVLGFKHSIPDSSTFYRFLNAFDKSLLIALCAQVNKAGLAATKTKLINLAIDAKPVVANTKDNNPKCFIHNLSDKTNPPKRNHEAALGFLSSTNDINGKAKTLFFWGYKLHLIVDADTDTPLVWKVEPANHKENKIAPNLYELLKKHYQEYLDDKPMQMADKGYDYRNVYESFYYTVNGSSIISPNRRNGQPNKALATDGSPLCKANLKMRINGSWYDPKTYRLRYKFRCPNQAQDCTYRKSLYGCTKYLQVSDPVPGKIQPFQLLFNRLYYKRQSVERVNAYLANVGFDSPKHFTKTAIQNLIGFALLAKSLSYRQQTKLLSAA
ncbi:MAG: transposase [Clostridia bacterium]|nr:transposase [Clostridia bacterium]